MDDDIRHYGPSQLRVFQTQLALSLVTGASVFVLFCFLRRRWPHMYAVRSLREALVQQRYVPKRLFAWIGAVWAILDKELLDLSGLDAYVVLVFFRMGIKVFTLLLVLAVVVLSPIRYYFTGNYDKYSITCTGGVGVHTAPLDGDFPAYLWMYPVFTYTFSVIAYVELFQHTALTIRTRQKYLAAQNSITDRTIKLDAIPQKLIRRNDPAVLKAFIEDLGIGRVVDVKLIYDWTPLEALFDARAALMCRLERLYARFFDLTVDLCNEHRMPRVVPVDAERMLAAPQALKTRLKTRIDALSGDLERVDAQIRAIQRRFGPRLSTYPVDEDLAIQPLSSAFITMDSVASAQMAAQTVLDPRVYKLLVTLAPAAKDVNWSSLRVGTFKNLAKSYLATFVIVLSYSVVFFLVSSLSSLLDVKVITRFWPALGHFIAKSKWTSTFVTGILPPLLFSAMNVALPYFYRSLSWSQGHALASDVELSTLLKNIFFIFFNLFLVFTISGTLWDFFTSIGDTMRFASQLASSLKKLSLFYVDYILLQGLVMFPVKLLQIGDFVVPNIAGHIFFVKRFFLRTPRDYRFFYYTPPLFDFGLHLPQHILIFIIVLIYSVVSTKIVVSGLVYFVLGYFVYKYQLVFTYVHAPHSTGKVWPMIFRRLVLGIVIFQLSICGTLALEGAFLLSVLCTPLFVVTLAVAWNFERFYVPLHSFIALRAIFKPGDYDTESDEDKLLSGGRSGDASTTLPANVLRSDASRSDASSHSESSLLLASDHSVRYDGVQRTRTFPTVDEECEQFANYTYPRLVDPLDGPWIGFEGNTISMVENRASVRGAGVLEAGTAAGSDVISGRCIVVKRIQVAEWE